MLSKLLARTGGTPGTVFQRDYAPLFTCTAMAWSAANLPLAAIAWLYPTLGALPLVWLTGAVYLYFLVLMFFAVRTVFGMENRTAAAVVCLSWIPLLAAAFLWGPLRSILGWLASPFVLFYLYYYLRSEAGNLGAGLRSGQNFRRTLDAAAVNPHDGEAQYQLGLIYQQRHQVTEAIQRFGPPWPSTPRRPMRISNWDASPSSKGGSRMRSREFQIVLDQDEKYHQSEILRELGALYNSARQFEDARQELARYVERRPYDPEGLYYYGQSLEGLGRFAEAREIYARASAAPARRPYT